MSAYNVFRLKNQALLVALAAAYPVVAQAAGVAHLDFASGSVVAVAAGGGQRNVGKGAEIGSGESIVTGDGGRAQLRFSDGGMISLQPKTEFKVDDYRYSGKDDGEEKGFFSLIRGGMRVITGLIGRRNRDAYKVTTSVATIGIRGTEYTADFNPAGEELRVHTGEGAVEVCSGAGCVVLGAGESGIVGGRNAQPQRTEVRPQLPPAQPENTTLPVFSTSDAFAVAGTYVPTSPMPVTGSATYSTLTSQSVGASQLTSASLVVDFGSLAFDVSLSGKVGTSAFSVSGSNSFSGNTLSANVSGSGTFCSCGCSGSMSGTFYGAAADSVGISYSVNNSFSSPTATATGSAAVSKTSNTGVVAF